MNRPEARNAFSREMMDALSAALPHLAVHPAVRLLVVTGAGNAKLNTAFSKIGLSGDFGGSYFLNHLAGAARARET